MSQIPTLDIQRFDNAASQADRDAFVAELGATYREWGFAGVRNHGIPQQLIDDAYRVFAEFFALPEDVKRRYHVAGGGGARGYTPFGVETAKGAQHYDLKEFWHIGREIPRDSKYANTCSPSVMAELDAQLPLSWWAASCGSSSRAVCSHTVLPVLRSSASTLY